MKTQRDMSCYSEAGVTEFQDLVISYFPHYVPMSLNRQRMVFVFDTTGSVLWFEQDDYSGSYLMCHQAQTRKAGDGFRTLADVFGRSVKGDGRFLTEELRKCEAEAQRGGGGGGGRPVPGV